MAPLLLASLIWIGLHLGIAGTGVRDALARRLGEGGFRATFSLASAIAITLLVLAWRTAPPLPLWTASPTLRWALAAAMLPAFILFAGSLMARNATSLGQNAALSAEPRGTLRITRHPMLWSFAIWAALHAIGNGDGTDLLFFGAFLVTALLGMPSLDAKVAARHPQAWPDFASRTSILPGGAILSGRNRMALGELAGPALVGTVGWAALLLLHPVIFGVPAIPL